MNHCAIVCIMQGLMARRIGVMFTETNSKQNLVARALDAPFHSTVYKAFQIIDMMF